MAELPKRIAAFTAAVIFLITTVGITVVVIWQATKQNTNNAGEQLVAQCQVANGVEAEILADPEPYKPTLPVGGLVKEDLEPGTGDAAKPGDCLHVKYYGSLADTGNKFDANFDKPTTIQFRLGTQSVIPGWDEGLIGLKLGGTRRLVIPPELGYRDQSVGEIPANSTLVFVVKLVKIGE